MNGVAPTGTYYFDGDHAVARAATLQFSSDYRELRIAVNGQAPLVWITADIRAVPDQAGRDKPVLRLKSDPVARLIVSDRSILAMLPNKNRPAPPKGRGRLFGWALAAVASVALIVGVLVPTMADQLAAYIPPEGERALGETTLDQIRDTLDDTGFGPVAFCENGSGMAALTRMEQKLTVGLSPETDLSVHVLDHDMVNAFALPGGFVVLFRGLIDAAEGPDEVAAVLAHEIGHVISRDPTRHALRSAGSIGVLGLLFGDFAGGAVVLFLTERLIDARYSQGAEKAADEFAYGRLQAADVSPAALGDMFERLRAKYGDSEGIVAHFLSHPALSDRITAARDAAPEGRTFAPILSDAEWTALQAVCD
jgi:hypothetical protein